MKAETLSKVKALIRKADEDELYEIMGAIVERRSSIRKERARHNTLTISVGDKVRLVNIRPKYLQGAIYQVVSTPNSARPRQFKLEVYMGADPRAQRRFGRYLNAPSDCVEKVLEAS